MLCVWEIRWDWKRRREREHRRIICIASTLLSAKFYNLIIQLAGYFMLKYNKRHFPISFGTNLSHYCISLYLCLSLSTPLWPLYAYIHSYIGPVDFDIFGNDCIFRSIHTQQIDWAENETKFFWVQWRTYIQCKNSQVKCLS